MDEEVGAQLFSQFGAAFQQGRAVGVCLVGNELREQQQFVFLIELLQDVGFSLALPHDDHGQGGFVDFADQGGGGCTVFRLVKGDGAGWGQTGRGEAEERFREGDVEVDGTATAPLQGDICLTSGVAAPVDLGFGVGLGERVGLCVGHQSGGLRNGLPVELADELRRAVGGDDEQGNLPIEGFCDSGDGVQEGGTRRDTHGDGTEVLRQRDAQGNEGRTALVGDGMDAEGMLGGGCACELVEIVDNDAVSRARTDNGICYTALEKDGCKDVYVGLVTKHFLLQDYGLGRLCNDKKNNLNTLPF